MKAQLALCMKYMPAACMKSLTLTHEGLEFGFDKFQFIEQRWGASSKMLLIFLFSTKSLGHVWFILPRLPGFRCDCRSHGR